MRARTGLGSIAKMGVDDVALMELGLLMKMVTKESPRGHLRSTEKVNDVDDKIEHATLLLTTKCW